MEAEKVGKILADIERNSSEKCGRCGKGPPSKFASWPVVNGKRLCGECRSAVGRARRIRNLRGLLKRAGVPPHFYRKAGTPDFTPRFKSEYAEANIYIWGDVGLGKTHLACEILAGRIIDGWRAQFITAAATAHRLQSCFGDRSRDSIDGIMKELCQYWGTVVIDNLTGESLTAMLRLSWFRLVDERWSRELPTIITANMSVEEVAEEVDGAYTQTADRLATYRNVHLEGESRRLNQ